MRRLSHSQIAESDIHHQLQIIADMIDFRKKFQSVLYIHMQDLIDAFASPFDSEDFCLVSFSITQFARNIGVRQKLQFHFFVSITITSRTSSFIRIETIIARIESQIFAFRRSCKELSDAIEGADKSSRA